METRSQICDAFYFPDPEAELAAVDNVIFPRLLATLNQAKIDYNLAANFTTDPRQRAYLSKHYLNILSKHHLLGEIVELRAETYAQRPMLATVMEQSANLTIDWMRFATNGELIISGTAEDFSKWAKNRIASERDFLKYFSGLVARAQTAQIKKHSTCNKNSA